MILAIFNLDFRLQLESGILKMKKTLLPNNRQFGLFHYNWKWIEPFVWKFNERRNQTKKGESSKTKRLFSDRRAIDDVTQSTFAPLDTKHILMYGCLFQIERFGGCCTRQAQALNLIRIVIRSYTLSRL